MKIAKIIFIITLASLALLAILTWTGVDNDLTAYIKGDYATAVEQFRQGAERGDAKAQHYLALMYDSGKGVPQSDAEALKWYSLSAEQGYASAQYNLSMMYYFGKGVPQDYVTAYKWIILADAQGVEQARDAKPALAEKLSPEQITQAQEAAQAWREKHRK